MKEGEEERRRGGEEEEKMFSVFKGQKGFTCTDSDSRLFKHVAV